jgi:hypothetical protein
MIEEVHFWQKLTLLVEGNKTLCSIAQHLDSDGIQTPCGKAWPPASVQKLVMSMEGSVAA